MKITFIGSSHGVPEPHRKCSCIMIEIGEQVYFIDMELRPSMPCAPGESPSTLQESLLTG